MMTTNALKKLKTKLPRGYVKKIATEADVSESTVRKTLSGERNNINVIRVAIDVAKNNSQETNDALKEIESL